MLLNDEADVSTPRMLFTSTRSRYLDYSTPLEYVKYSALIRTPLPGDIELDLFSMFGMNVWALVMSITAFLLVHRICLPETQYWTDKSWSIKSLALIGGLWSLFITVFLSYFNNALAINFYQPLKPEFPFTTFEALGQLLLAGQYNILLGSRIAVTTLYQKRSKADLFYGAYNYFHQSLDINPPQLIQSQNDSVVMGMVQTDRKYVYITDNFYEQILQRQYCGFATVAGESSIPSYAMGFYMSKPAKLKIDYEVSGLISWQYKHFIALVQRNQTRYCPQGSADYSPHPRLVRGISFMQFQIVFLLLLNGLTICVIVFIFENQLKNCFRLKIKLVTIIKLLPRKCSNCLHAVRIYFVQRLFGTVIRIDR